MVSTNWKENAGVFAIFMAIAVYVFQLIAIGIEFLIYNLTKIQIKGLGDGIRYVVYVFGFYLIFLQLKKSK